MKSLSLVVATIGRDEEIKRLLDSLIAQTRSADEIIIVDQNIDDRVEQVISCYPCLPILRLRTPPMGANAARNYGLKHVKCDLVGFPDDDCWYASNVIERVCCSFEDSQLCALSGRVETSADGISSGRWQTVEGSITRRNVWTTTIEFAAFFSTDLLVHIGGFDERIGPGARSIYGAHEIDDLFIRLLEYTDSAKYDPTIRINHNEPIRNYDFSTLNRAFRYGAGLGYVIKKHHYSPVVLFSFLARSLGGGLVSFVRREPGKGQFYLAVFLGRLFGWLFANRCTVHGKDL